MYSIGAPVLSVHIPINQSHRRYNITPSTHPCNIHQHRRSLLVREKAQSNSPSEQLDLHPIHRHHTPIPQAEQRAQIRAPPEQIRPSAARAERPLPDRQIRNRLVAADVRQAALVRVVERPEALDLLQLLLDVVDLEHGGARAAEGVPLLAECVGLGDLHEHSGEVGALLGCDLCRGRIRARGTIPDREDASVCSLHPHLVVDTDPPSVRLHIRKVLHQVPADLTGFVSTRPDDEATGDLLVLALGRLHEHAVRLDLLHHRLRQHVDLRLLERVERVADQLLAEHRQDGRQGLDQGDPDLARQLGVPLLEILFEEIVELTGELDTRRTTADNDSMQEAVDFALGLAWESGSFDTCIRVSVQQSI
jgi:hypothetical protein